MTQKFNTGKTFTTGEQVTAQDLEDIVEKATPLTALTDDQTLTIVADKITVKDGSSTDGVTLSKMQHIAPRSVICNIGSSTAAPSALSIPNNQVLKGSANGLEAGTIDNDNLTNNGISIDADSGTTHEIDLGETLTVTGGTGIDTTINDTNNTLTIAGSNATTSAKGIASFSSSDFSVTSGAVSIKPLGVSNAQLAGSIATSKLTANTIGVGAGSGLTGGGAIGLGGSKTLNVSGVTNSMISDTAAIANSKLANSSVTVDAGTGLSGGGSVALGGSTTITLNSAIPNNSTTNTQSSTDNSTKLATTAFVQSVSKSLASGFTTLASGNTSGTASSDGFLIVSHRATRTANDSQVTVTIGSTTFDTRLEYDQRTVDTYPIASGESYEVSFVYASNEKVQFKALS